jgi:hypothetical protein
MKLVVLKGLLGSTPASKSRVSRQGSCAPQATIPGPAGGNGKRGAGSAARAFEERPKVRHIPRQGL